MLHVLKTNWSVPNVQRGTSLLKMVHVKVNLLWQMAHKNIASYIVSYSNFVHLHLIIKQSNRDVIKDIFLLPNTAAFGFVCLVRYCVRYQISFGPCVLSFCSKTLYIHL